MSSRFVHFCVFHFRRLLRTQLPWLLACMASLTILLVMLSAWSWQWNQIRSMREDAKDFQTSISKRKQENAEIEKKMQAPVNLPTFHNASFVTALHKVAGKARLTINELSYVLDDAPSMPYFRYRIQFSVLSNYPSVRRFVKELNQELPYVTLDAISCSREDIVAPDVTCDLSLTAFFARGERG